MRTIKTYTTWLSEEVSEDGGVTGIVFILEKTIRQLQSWQTTGVCRDVNGNVVGEFYV